MVSERTMRVGPDGGQPPWLVVYDSKYGNTERIAQVITETLAGSSPARALHVGQVKAPDLEGVTLLVMGCPTQAWHATPAMTVFLASIPRDRLKAMAVACFDTRYDKPRWLTGSAARHLAKLVKQAGGQLLTPPESFFVDRSEGPLAAGELERAEGWANSLAASFAKRGARVHLP
ncbi:MAG TPA: flavodoxin domain-containing protein [Caldilineaceae bacterium]|nr:flavodoxin domain-containing protein [Caldilineaceae bacterium]